MGLLDRRFLWVLMSLVPAFFCAHLLAQSPQSRETAPSDQGLRTYKSVFNFSDVVRRMDYDQDGFITRNEWERFFDDSDKNADKRLAPEEIGPFMDQEVMELDKGRLAAFDRLDINKNNGIEASEWPGKDKDFSYLDANHNRSLSREEFLSRDGRFWNEPFENLDFNDDGLIYRSEWLDSDSAFDKLDRDRNGVIERREFYNPR
jgi:Ca2+-binding EF-hand superfamily protein